MSIEITVETLHSALRKNVMLRYDVERKTGKLGHASPDSRYQVDETELYVAGDSELARALMMKLMLAHKFTPTDVQLELGIGDTGYNNVRDYLSARLRDSGETTISTKRFNMKWRLLSNFLYHEYGIKEKRPKEIEQLVKDTQ